VQDVPNFKLEDVLRQTKAELVIANAAHIGQNPFQQIKRINDYFPDVRFVIYSAYADDDYMKKSMENGVIDYMYKPVKPGELNRCLTSATNYFRAVQNEREVDDKMTATYRKHLEYYKLVFLNNLMAGNIRNENEIKNEFQYFGIGLEPPFTVLLCRIDRFQTLILALDEKEKQMLSYKLMSVIKTVLGGQKFNVFIGSYNCVSIILSGDHDIKTLMAFAERIKDAEFRRNKVRVTVGIGRTYDDYTDIFISNREANAAVNYRCNVGYNSVIPIQFVEPDNHITYRYPAELEDRLVKAAMVGEYSYCADLLKRLMDALSECGELPDKLISKIVTGITIAINRAASECMLPISDVFLTIFPMKEALDIVDVKDATNYLKRTLKEFCKHVVKVRAEKSKNLYEESLKYIEEHYHETFSVHKLAANLHTTPEYLANVFEKNAGKNILQYIVGVRIAEAKKLYADKNTDDDIVAIKVGYDNADYFRSIFRQHEGMTTAEYKRIQGGKK
jgi:two-component system response regulator YesN